ncbi:flagellar hook-length control protein FliK [Agarivorans sp. QJM3NY_25]|uniref:flagellar hook-length control protein FliK n=1 Tax=Agarivorans sp. QJM3NY_25 TaxID=3421430 RepID=UPI003D7EB7B6
MELLLTDTAGANQFSALSSASLSPSAGAGEFAKMVSELDNLPKAENALGSLVKEQFVKPQTEQNASQSSLESQSPSDLLKQLTDAKQVVVDLNQTGAVEGEAESEQPQSTAKLTDLTTLSEKEDTDVKASGRDLPLDIETDDVDLSLEDSNSAAEAHAKASSDSEELLNLDEKVTEDKTAADSDETDPDSDLIAMLTKDSSLAEVTASSKSQSSDQVDSESVETANTKLSNGTPTQLEKQNVTEGSSVPKQAVSTVVGDAAAKDVTTQVSDRPQQKVASDLSKAEASRPQQKVASDLSKAEASSSGTPPENKTDDKQSVNAQSTPLSGHSKLEQVELAKNQSTHATGRLEQTDITKAQNSKLEQAELAKSQSAQSAQANSIADKSAGSDTVKADPGQQAATVTSKVESNLNAVATSGERRSVNQTSTSSGNTVVAAQQSGTTNDTKLNANLSQAKEITPEQQQPTPHRVVDAKVQSFSQVAESANKTQSGTAESGAQADKFASSAFADGRATSEGKHSDDHQQQGQAQQHTAAQLGLTESARAQQTNHHFNGVSGAESVNRTEQNGEISLKQAQQANQLNDKNGLMNQRLNPSQYQAPAELNQRVQYMLSQGMHKAEIRLDPAELGSMHVRLQMNHEQQVSVHIQVQNPQAREALEQTMPRLREMLQQQGIELGQSSVNQQHQGSSSNQGQGQSLAGGGTESLRRGIEGGVEQELDSSQINQSSRDGIDFYA